MKYSLGVLVIVSVSSVCFAANPTITNVTNAALPGIDFPPGAIHLAPRSLATIFGSNLSDSTAAASLPWPKSLAGIEVHLLVEEIGINNSQSFICSTDCDLTATLLYASPGQINFLTPDSQWARQSTRIVLVKNGTRFDNFGCAQFTTHCPPGSVYLDTFISDRTVFQVGYDCLFSFSAGDPGACGFSLSAGNHRSVLGAMTDSAGRLITSSNPVRQGQLITLWETGLTGLTKDPRTGLLRQASPSVIGFAVAQQGKDIPATVGFDSFTGAHYGLLNSTPVFAGESPQFPGLDQVNVPFPTCKPQALAATEKRYDAFLSFITIEAETEVRTYFPFVVKPGDPDCGW